MKFKWMFNNCTTIENYIDECEDWWHTYVVYTVMLDPPKFL